LGYFFLWVVSLKITEVALFLSHFFPRFKLCTKSLTKMGWATFWAIFSQTDLVTLRASEQIGCGQDKRPGVNLMPSRD
jgi:hypothetical protein